MLMRDRKKWEQQSTFSNAFLFDFLGCNLKISWIKGRLHETAKIDLIFAVQPILPGRLSDFCKHPTDGHHIAQNQTER